MNRLRRPSLSDSRPKNSAPMISPIRYQEAMLPACEVLRWSVALSVRSGTTLAAIVISRPSRTQATPSAMINRVWNLDHGRRSIRAGMVLRIVGASAVPDADAIVHLRLGVGSAPYLPRLSETTQHSDLQGSAFPGPPPASRKPLAGLTTWPARGSLVSLPG